MENMNKIERFFLKKHLEEEEFVFYVVHKHWIELVNPMIKWGLLWVIIPLAVIWFYPSFYLYSILWFLFVVLMIFYDFFDWYLDVMILSDHSIIHAEWNWFFHSLSSRMPYESIDAVYYEHDWVASSGFNYWNLEIEREWWNRTVFENCANPKTAELKILEAQKRREWNRDVDMWSLKKLLSQLVAEHMDWNWFDIWKKKRGFKKKAA